MTQERNRWTKELFTILTDHANLQYWKSPRNLNRHMLNSTLTYRNMTIKSSISWEKPSYLLTLYPDHLALTRETTITSK